VTFAVEHAGALEDIRANGQAVTFASTTMVYDAANDTSTSSTTSVAGYAMEVGGDPKQYERLSLKEEDTLTLLFAATTYGQLPALGSQVTWASKIYTVRHVKKVAPDGTAIIARVVVSR